MNTVRSAQAYIDDVLSGRQLACRYVRLAVQRHVDDLATADGRGFYFDESAAAKALRFFDFVKHSKGIHAGKPFILEPWQAFIVYVVYGWKKTDGYRRFNEAYVEVAKKNGKTTLLSGLATMALTFDNEAGAEVYAAAYTRDQASICFDEAVSMVKSSPDLRKRVRTLAHNMSVTTTRSKFQAVSHDANNTEGKNAHFVSFDEYHVHRNDKVKESLKSGMAARMQPLFFIITTAGSNVHGPCYSYRKDCVKVLEGSIKRDHVFCIVFTLDEKDDWKDPANWPKANPNWGQSVNPAFIEAEIKTATDSINSTKEADVKTKHLNIWVKSGKRWIADETWAGLPLELAHPGEIFYGGLDLASVNDFTSYALLFPPSEHSDRFRLATKHFISRKNFDARLEGGFEDLIEWERDGWLTVTDTPTTDYRVVRASVEASALDYSLQYCAFDRHNSSQLINELTESLGSRSEYIDGKAEDFTLMQGYSMAVTNVSTPVKGFFEYIENDRLAHDHNPVMRWMLANVMIKTDGKENWWPDKATSGDKIDGPVASIMALGEYLTWNWQKTESPYETRGLRSFTF
jgi:phage terminase large subunit-like protein